LALDQIGLLLAILIALSHVDNTAIIRCSVVILLYMRSVSFFRWYFALMSVWQLAAVIVFTLIGGAFFFVALFAGLGLGRWPMSPQDLAAALAEIWTLLWALSGLYFAFALPAYWTTDRIAYVTYWLHIMFWTWLVLAIASRQIPIPSVIQTISAIYLLIALHRSQPRASL